MSAPTEADFRNAARGVWPAIAHGAANLRPAAGHSRRWQPGDEPVVGVVELDSMVGAQMSYTELAMLAELLGTDLIDIEGSIDGGYYPGDASAVLRIVVRWRRG